MKTSRLGSAQASGLAVGRIDITAVNVALPTIGTDVHAKVSGLQWTVDAYTVVTASLLMFAGSLGASRPRSLCHLSSTGTRDRIGDDRAIANDRGY